MRLSPQERKARWLEGARLHATEEDRWLHSHVADLFELMQLTDRQIALLNAAEECLPDGSLRAAGDDEVHKARLFALAKGTYPASWLEKQRVRPAAGWRYCYERDGMREWPAGESEFYIRSYVQNADGVKVGLLGYGSHGYFFAYSGYGVSFFFDARAASSSGFDPNVRYKAPIGPECLVNLPLADFEGQVNEARQATIRAEIADALVDGTLLVEGFPYRYDRAYVDSVKFQPWCSK